MLDHAVDFTSYVSDARLDIVPVVLAVLEIKGEKPTRCWSYESVEDIQ